MPVYQLDPDLVLFPPPQLARYDGLLAVGGDLSPQRLLLAYRMGIFPWYAPDEPILWWAPDPRLVLFPEEFHCSRRLARILRQGRFTFSVNRDFAAVIRNCAAIHRPGQEGSWLGEEMIAAYSRLHELGYAHSVECRRDGALVGGIYGLGMGRVFFGESMFSREPNASKAALAHLVVAMQASGGSMIDCQVSSDHMRRLGARLLPGRVFYQRLALDISDDELVAPRQPAALLL
ncbi:leucyl/phenylalanyl-tRNA--protein transferase [Desulfurivibrio dismutans]|uniref:leucyl/phenylalanyl-tRNA--protein transferase n=1 Tax=Desulfurivibrio dismutans TaxID=1398908 RepID=UPI0023DCC45D|nr:leucyl/phenylalanyl-tRNA--protein transferase [Desulfurivibrio alkaliphilus]MDF1614427.1 leucyl/phenylalanyl-tRNA--protein transferase [Desulfurivibrio alkaliphilus]